jgi:twitching motility protein PilT
MIDHVNRTAARTDDGRGPDQFLPRQPVIVNQRGGRGHAVVACPAERAAQDRTSSSSAKCGLETIERACGGGDRASRFSTLHPRRNRTINRIIAVFPPHQQKQVRLQLAAVLKAVSQRLIPRSDGRGRVPAVEVMIATAFIRDCIVDKERTTQIPAAIAAGTSQYGMQTFDQSIFGLFEQGLVSYDEALRWASNVDEFKLKVQGISTNADMGRDAITRFGA